MGPGPERSAEGSYPHVAWEGSLGGDGTGKVEDFAGREATTPPDIRLSMAQRLALLLIVLLVGWVQALKQETSEPHGD